jgi:hypothetical protein
MLLRSMTRPAESATTNDPPAPLYNRQRPPGSARGSKCERLTASTCRPVFCQLQTLFRENGTSHLGPGAYIPRGPVIAASDCSVLAQAARNLAGELTDIRQART